MRKQDGPVEAEVGAVIKNAGWLENFAKQGRGSGGGVDIWYMEG